MGLPTKGLPERVWDIAVSYAKGATMMDQRENARQLYTEIMSLMNARPQSSPPAGEPDWDNVTEQAFFVLGIKSLTGDEVRAELIALAKHVYRLGQASRPKVEDAEVTWAVEWLRVFAKNWSDGVAGANPQDNPAHDIADLLERLAGERESYRSDEVYVRSLLLTTQAKLAATESELAKADAAICNHFMCGKEIQLLKEPWFSVMEKIVERHAARQQQAAAQSDGETR